MAMGLDGVTGFRAPSADLKTMIVRKRWIGICKYQPHCL